MEQRTRKNDFLSVLFQTLFHKDFALSISCFLVILAFFSILLGLVWERLKNKQKVTFELNIESKWPFQKAFDYQKIIETW